jgi:hypothetical protein
MEREEKIERRENREYPERRGEHSVGIPVWKIVGGAALVLAAAAVILNLSDIKRYIKISSM